MSTLIRATVTGAKPETKLRELQTSFNKNSVQSDLEHLEPYGFTSEPFVDGQTDALNLYFDEERNHGVVLTVADRRYRITNMQQGEVAIYDDKGRHIYLKRDGIEVDGVSSPITIKTSGKVIINAAGNCEITAPTVTINGNMVINGKVTTSSTISASGNISSQGDVSGGGISLRGHTHTGDSGGSTSTPK